jgi:hypothetical protein
MKFSPVAALVFLTALLAGGIGQATTITFDLAPEITFEVPTGWSACDPVTGAKLQGSPSKGALKTLCKGFNDKGGARMVGSPDGSVAMSFVLAKPGDFPPALFERMTPEQISSDSAALCQSVLHIPPSAAPCVFELRGVAGRTALVGRVEAPDGRFDLSRMVMVPGNRQTAIFIFLASPPSAEADDRMHEIIASIRASRT